MSFFVQNLKIYFLFVLSNRGFFQTQISYLPPLRFRIHISTPGMLKKHEHEYSKVSKFAISDIKCTVTSSPLHTASKTSLCWFPLPYFIWKKNYSMASVVFLFSETFRQFRIPTFSVNCSLLTSILFTSCSKLPPTLITIIKIAS